MSDEIKTTIINAFKNLHNLIRDGAANAVLSTYWIVEVPRPITRITSLSGNFYWLSNQDIQTDLELYVPKGKYDSVHVVWNNGPIDAYLGLGGIFINDGTTTFSSLIAGQEWWWTGLGEAFGEPFLHEWLHGVCRFYQNLGYSMPERDADGAEVHGYIKSHTEGWMEYYRDLMRGQVWEPKLSTFTGITKEAWSRGAPKGTTTIFLDVPSGYWAENYIIAIYNAGTTTGCVQDDPATPENERQYCPENSVTRE